MSDRSALCFQHTALKHLSTSHTQTQGSKYPRYAAFFTKRLPAPLLLLLALLEQSASILPNRERTQSAPARARSQHRPLIEPSTPSTQNPTRDKQETNQRPTTPTAQAYESHITPPEDAHMTLAAACGATAARCYCLKASTPWLQQPHKKGQESTRNTPLNSCDHRQRCCDKLGTATASVEPQLPAATLCQCPSQHSCCCYCKDTLDVWHTQQEGGPAAPVAKQLRPPSYSSKAPDRARPDQGMHSISLALLYSAAPQAAHLCVSCSHTNTMNTLQQPQLLLDPPR